MGLPATEINDKVDLLSMEIPQAYNIKSIMNDTPLTKYINLKELSLLLDWLRLNPDRKTIAYLAGQKYAPQLKNLSPDEVYTKAHNRNIKTSSKEMSGETAPHSCMERWDFNEYAIFVWISAYLSLKEYVQLQQMTAHHIAAIQRIFSNKSIPFIHYNLKNLCYVLYKKNEEWKPEEIRLLETVMSEFRDRPDWKLISFRLFCMSNTKFFRTVPQCRQKWLNYLNPKIKKDKWTQDEDNLLFTMIDEVGCRWSHISKAFKLTRNEHSIKNRFNYYKKIWKRDNPNAKPVKLTPLMKKVLQENDFDLRQEPVTHITKTKFKDENQSIRQEGSCGECAHEANISGCQKMQKNSPTEQQATSYQQKMKQTKNQDTIDLNPNSIQTKNEQLKKQPQEASYQQFHLSNFLLCINQQMKIKKQTESTPNFVIAPEMGTSHEMEDDVVRILGCSHYEVIISHEEWIGRLEEQENMDWIDI